MTQNCPCGTEGPGMGWCLWKQSLASLTLFLLCILISAGSWVLADAWWWSGFPPSPILSTKLPKSTKPPSLSPSVMHVCVCVCALLGCCILN